MLEARQSFSMMMDDLVCPFILVSEASRDRIFTDDLFSLCQSSAQDKTNLFVPET